MAKPAVVGCSRSNAGLEASLEAVLEKRRAAGLLRGISIRAAGQVDFCSNDYLGFATDHQLACEVDAAYAEFVLVANVDSGQLEAACFQETPSTTRRQRGCWPISTTPTLH